MLKASLCQRKMQTRFIAEWWLLLEAPCSVFAVILLLGNGAYFLKGPASGKLTKQAVLSSSYLAEHTISLLYRPHISKVLPIVS